MIVFNSWYYSFSPSVANYLTDHWVERTVMKGVLYPLIGMMSLSSATFSAVSLYPEMAVLLAGLVASSLIGAFYVGLPLALIRARIRRMSGRRVEPLLAQLVGITFLAGMILLVIGEVAASQLMLMIASSTIVLSTLSLSAIATSSFLSKRIASHN